MVLDISGAVFLTFRGFQKTPDFRTRHRWSEWTFCRNTSNTGRSGHCFLDGVYLSIKLLRTRLLTDTFQMRLSRMRVPLFGSSWKLGEIIDQTYFD